MQLSLFLPPGLIPPVTLIVKPHLHGVEILLGDVGTQFHTIRRLFAGICKWEIQNVSKQVRFDAGDPLEH